MSGPILNSTIHHTYKRTEFVRKSDECHQALCTQVVQHHDKAVNTGRATPGDLEICLSQKNNLFMPIGNFLLLQAIAAQSILS